MPDRSTARSNLAVDFLTRAHRITCQVDVGSTGLVGLLNDVHTSTFTAHSAYISRLYQPAQIVAHLPEVHLSKASLAVGLLARREDVGPSAYVRLGASRPISAQVLLTTEAFEVRGTAEFISRLDADFLLVGGSVRFLVLYDATALSAHDPETSFSAPAMFLNRSMATGLGQLPKGKA